MRRGDKLIGENTDGVGFMEFLRTLVDPMGKSVVVFGAGGAARAIAVESALAGATKLTIVNRGKTRGRELTALINDKTKAAADFVLWDRTYSIDRGADIIVNATSIGLFPDVDARLDIDLANAGPEAIVADVIPNPPRTLLVRDAEARGLRTLDGLGMLVNQGVVSIRHWFGIDVEPAADAGEARGIVRGLTEAVEAFLQPQGLQLNPGQGGNRCPMLIQNPAERQAGFGRSLAPWLLSPSDCITGTASARRWRRPSRRRPPLRPLLRPRLRRLLRPSLRPLLRPPLRRLLRPSLRPHLRPRLRPTPAPVASATPRPRLRSTPAPAASRDSCARRFGDSCARGFAAPAPVASATPAPAASAAPCARGFGRHLRPPLRPLRARGFTGPSPRRSPATEPPTLRLSNENGVVHVSGSVHDEGAKVSILDALKSVFGADKVQAEIGVDANRGPAPWLAKLGDALASLKTSGVQADFDGGSVNVGGTIGDADRDRIIASLKSAFGEGLSLGVLTEHAADAISSANAKATTELMSLNSAFEAGFAPEGLIAALNKSIVSFPLASAEVPAAAAPFLRSAAADLTQLRAGHVLEIAGYTDNTGDPALNVALSQKRAEAVRDALIKYGADPAMLIAKGYGSADPIASNDTSEGRLRNRRIEYHVVSTP